MRDLISRQAAIDMAVSIPMFGRDVKMVAVGEIKNLPSAQPEITEEQAIEHLQSTGWMQNHDREMYDMGLKKQLTDDSGSYDSLLPSAQPDMSEYSSKLWRNAYERGKRDAQSEEDCDTCKHGYFGDDQCNNCRVRYPSHYERRTDD